LIRRSRIGEHVGEEHKQGHSALDAADHINDLRIPLFRLHALKAPPYIGYWSIDVSGNYRIIFEFSNGKATNLNYLDTH